jgi:hypothetical protein
VPLAQKEVLNQRTKSQINAISKRSSEPEDQVIDRLIECHYKEKRIDEYN